MKDEGTPFKRVLLNIFDTASVAAIPNKITVQSRAADIRLPAKPVAPARKNIVITAMSVGNLPLQGTKLFVSMAIIRSLGESIILHPVTPTALQPKPIHIVSACFPQVFAFLK